MNAGTWLPGSMHHMTLERFHAGAAWQLGMRKGAEIHNHKLGFERVVSIRCDSPQSLALVPSNTGTFGVKKGIFVQSPFISNHL